MATGMLWAQVWRCAERWAVQAAGEGTAEDAVLALLRAWAPHHRASRRSREPAECLADAPGILSTSRCEQLNCASLGRHSYVTAACIARQFIVLRMDLASMLEGFQMYKEMTTGTVKATWVHNAECQHRNSMASGACANLMLHVCHLGI